MKSTTQQMQKAYKIILTTILLSVFILSTTKVIFAQQNNSTDIQEELKIQLQIRPRAELRNGVFTPILQGEQPAAFISQRNRLGLIYSKGNQITTSITLQMLNVWGNDAQVQQTANNVSLFEAWVQMALSKKMQIKMGRQILSYDDERILGSLDWHNAGRKHDAVLLMHEKGKLKTHIGLAFNQNTEKVNNTFFNDAQSQPYKSLQFAWLQYKVNDSLKFTTLLMNQAKQKSTDSLYATTQTFGVNAFYKTAKLNATASVYLQTGKSNIKNAAAINTSAWMASLYGNYSVSKKFTLGIGSDYLSGMDMGSTSNKMTAFNPLYGTHHKFYGYMDYFYVASPHNNTGLWDSYLNASLKADKKTNFQIAVHHFVSPVSILNYQNKAASAYLGNEIDLSFNYSLDNGAKIIGGVGQMLPSASMKYIKNIPDSKEMKPMQNWIWISIIVNPEIKLFSRNI